MKGNIFIKRPVMAISISVLILAIGLISLFTLPVEQYPDIAPPTVYVAASYTGADAEAVMNSVIMPLEESINGVEDMMYITSSASNAGLAIIQVYFKQGTDPDMAAVNVQNRVAKAQGLLPAEVTKVGVSTTDQLPANRRAGLHRRSLRPDLPCQLSGHQRHPADQAYRGSRRRHGAGRYLQYAYLAETGTDGTIRAGAFGHHRRAGRAEH